MAKTILTTYDALILRRPWLSLAVVLLVLLASASQLGKIRLDASADALLLQGDPSLEFFREVSKEYRTEEFLIVTWQPNADLFSDESLQPLRRMADEIRQLKGVASVTTVWDVPLLESPPVKLADVTSSQPLPTLATPGLDMDLVKTEFTTSPIYSELLVSRDGQMSAVQINLRRDERYNSLLQHRETLRQLRDGEGLSAAQEQELAQVEHDFKMHTAATLHDESRLVQQVRDIVAEYADYARLFVGGVPMIAVDMVSFVQSDLVVFGSAILGVMVLVLAIIFRRPRWVVIPLLTCSGSVLVMLGILGVFDWRMTVISSNFVAVLLIISLAIAIHLIVRYRELEAAEPEGDLHARVLSTVALMAVPCLYTGITTIVAFVSLVVSGIQPVIDFGWMMTAGIVVALTLAFVIVPCMILLWPKGRPVRYASEGKPFTLYFARIADRYGRAVLVVSGVIMVMIVYGISQLKVENRFIDYFKDTTEIYQGMELLDSKLGGTIPLDIILSAPATDTPLPGLEPASGGATEEVAADDPFLEENDSFAADQSAGDAFADDGFGDEMGDEMGDGMGGEFDDEFESDFDSFSEPGSADFSPSFWFSVPGMRILDTAHQHISEQPETGKVLSLSTIFAVVKDLLGDDIGSVELALVQKSLPASIKGMMVDPYFAQEQDQARINVRVKETSKSLRRNEFLTRLRTELLEETGLAPEQIQFTGMLVLYNNVLQSLFRSQILTLGAVFAVILVMFLLLFRSLSLALIALAPNILAAGLVLGIMGVLGIPLDIMTITIAAIVVGIGVDNCIHYVHRYRREFKLDRNYRDTMYRCHGSIGRALYYTTITLVIGFSMLTLSSFSPSIYFGLLTVLAMTAAVVGALLLLPKLIMVFRPLGPGGVGIEGAEIAGAEHSA